MSYLDRSDKQVVSTTYKDIHELVDKVSESGFFDAVSCVSAEPDAEAAEMEPASDEAEPLVETEPAAVGDGMSPVYFCCLSHLLILFSYYFWLLLNCR